MSPTFVVEGAGCESCAALVREALEPLSAVESIEVDEGAAGASVGTGHAYRVQPGSWRGA